MKQVAIGKIIRHGATPDGRMLCVEFQEPNGTPSVLFVPRAIEGQFLVTFQAAALSAAEQSGVRPTDESLGALEGEGATLAVDANGRVSIQIPLQHGPDLNFPISRPALEALVQKAKEALEYLDQGGSPVAH